MLDLEGLTALVTGAGAGIGKGIATTLAREGASVAVLDIDQAAAEVTASEIRAMTEGSARAEAIVCDVADEHSVRMAFDRAEQAFGVVDATVNNAGIYYLRPFLEISVADWDRIFSVNVRGLALCMQEAIRRLKAAGRGGSIINISSVNSRRALIFDNIHYSATKAAVNGITQSSALEFAELGIRINAVLPGSIVSEGTGKLRSTAVRRGPIVHPERIPLGHRGEPSDIADAVAYLASPRSRYVTGQLFAVDGGFEIS